MNKITIEQFKEVDIRVGQIIKITHLKDGKYSTHKLQINFGKEIGIKQSCARLVNYSDEELQNKFIVGILNFPPKQIGKNMSEVLILGVPDENGECILLSPDNSVPMGGRVY
ncbi:tRNA-binding protein [Candidatus Dojkabacteria bacterium]|uniref:tRNA-binding protein n=1 Tax=Candidatus Dojkabacteria bacterium TaxID=2099670 RepID=A0A955L9N5_9BACT|nr:tRNA-binding protein [Candidatus Dojkabacteria bacterium]